MIPIGAIVSIAGTLGDAHGANATPATWAALREPLRVACVRCHTSDGSPPFGLESPVGWRKRRSTILRVLAEGLMPPPAPSGEFAFRDEHSLSNETRAALVRWLEEGAAGDGPPIVDARVSGPPNLTARIVEPWSVPAEGSMTMRSFILPIADRGADILVRGVRVRMSDPKVLRGASAASDEMRLCAVLDADDPGGGYTAMGDVCALPSGSLGAVGPSGVWTLPDGFAFRLPARGDLVLEVAVQPIGREVTFDGSVEFALAPPGARIVESLLLAPVPFEIPAGARDARAEATVTLNRAVDVVGFLGRAGPLCRTLRLDATLPDGSTRRLGELSWVPDFRRPHSFETPVALPAGSRLTASFAFDNSADNPRNPHQIPRPIPPGVPPEGEAASLVVWIAPRP